MSTIQWTDETWNPTVGCSRVSPGCDNCYAIRVAAREMQDAHRGLTADGDWTGEVRCLPDRLVTPLRWRKPRRVFVDSMSDLFHPDVPSDFIAEVYGVMTLADQHTFQVLTKRPQAMARFMQSERDHAKSVGIDTWRPPPNIWLGTSVENQRYADLRIPHLLATPAAVRFLSVEPMLGPVSLVDWFWEVDEDETTARAEHGTAFVRATGDIDWVIIGGESGPGARPVDIEWVEQLVAECHAAGVAVFVKQLGSVVAKARGWADRKGGNVNEWPTELRVREWPA
jgi:protein gp37